VSSQLTFARTMPDGVCRRAGSCREVRAGIGWTVREVLWKPRSESKLPVSLYRVPWQLSSAMATIECHVASASTCDMAPLATASMARRKCKVVEFVA
jgi:hypothetical protein